MWSTVSAWAPHHAQVWLSLLSIAALILRHLRVEPLLFSALVIVCLSLCGGGLGGVVVGLFVGLVGCWVRVG